MDPSVFSVRSIAPLELPVVVYGCLPMAAWMLETFVDWLADFFHQRSNVQNPPDIPLNLGWLMTGSLSMARYNRYIPGWLFIHTLYMQQIARGPNWSLLEYVGWFFSKCFCGVGGWVRLLPRAKKTKSVGGSLLGSFLCEEESVQGIFWGLT